MFYAWSQGAFGAGIRIADIEWAFNREHEDLCNIEEPVSQVFSTETPFSFVKHGTAVLGELVGWPLQRNSDVGAYAATLRR